VSPARQGLLFPGDAPLDCSAEVETPFDALLEEIREFWTPLRDKPEETLERVLCALWRTAAGAPVSADRAVRDGLPSLDSAATGRLRELLARKRSGVPLAHLTQRQTFLGLELLAGPDALIPRKETEILGRAALAKLHCLAQARGALTVIDVCTGSGNLALAYAHYEPGARVYASDLCQSAVDLSRRNLEHLSSQRDLCGRVEFRQGDLLEPFDTAEFHGKCDFLSCNPPYISASKVKQMHPEIAQFEPEAAFNGGVYGVSILMKLLKNAPRFLKPGSWLGFEVGLGQGALTARQLEKNPAFSAVETCADEAGEIRAIFAKSKGLAGA
jgi:release factor glutamine methyltransferase